jgi:hypothetical protein
MRRSIRRAGLARLILAILFFAQAGRASAGLVYSISGAGGGASVLSTINPTTGAATSTVGTITVGGTGVMVSSIAFNPLDQGLFGVAINPVSGKGELLSINLGTAVATPIGALGLTPPNTNAASIAFAPSGALYGYVKTGSQPESFFTINRLTGAASLIGPSNIGSTSGNGLAFNAAGTLYFAGKGATGALYTVDPSTGQTTAGPTLTGAPLTLSQIKGLAFDEAGTLFGVDLQPTSFLASLVKINPATGAITNVGGMQDGTIALAFQGAAIPEPSSAALIIVLGLGWGVRTRFGRK